MTVIDAYNAVFVLVVLYKSRNFLKCLFRYNEMEFFTAFCKFTSYSKAEAVDSNEVEFTIFNVEKFAGENRFAFVE